MTPTYSRRKILAGLAAAGLTGCARQQDADTALQSGEEDSGQNDTGTEDETLGVNPAADGFFLPAETEAHSGCLMQFPPADHYCQEGEDSCTFLDNVRSDWAAAALAVAQFEPVRVYVEPADVKALRALCGSSVEVVEAPLDDGWSRDTAPNFLRDLQGRVRAMCFEFNGWGESYSYEEDAEVQWQMVSDLGVAAYRHPMVLEGGAVITDGAGTLVTTQECLLHDQRNPHLSQSEQTQILKDWLGVERVIWLENGWVPDPLTNGHVDGIAAFVSPGTILLNSISEQEDAINYAILESARQILEEEGLEVIRLPATSFTAFHINFYLANGGLIVPVQGVASVDDEPVGILRACFPQHEIVEVPCNHLGRAGGGIHCITQPVPQGLVWPTLGS